MRQLPRPQVTLAVAAILAGLGLVVDRGAVDPIWWVIFPVLVVLGIAAAVAASFRLREPARETRNVIWLTAGLLTTAVGMWGVLGFLWLELACRDIVSGSC